MATPKIMFSSPALVLQTYLIQQDLLQPVFDEPPWVSFVQKEPTEPNQVITVYNTTAIVHGKQMKYGITTQHFGIQIRVKSGATATKTEDVIAQRKAIYIETFLSQNLNLTNVSGCPGDEGSVYVLQNYHIVSPVTFVMQEAKNRRQIYVMNGTLTVFPLGGF